MLTIDSLTCRRGMRVVLRGVSAAVPVGGCLLVTGANGSGKSTLLRAVAGVVPVGGDIRWNGAFVANDIVAYRDQLHYVGHQDAVKPELTAAEMLQYWALMQTQDAPKQVVGGGFGVEVFLNRPIRLLSAGQKRRLALTRLLLTSRPLWLLDEPATALDMVGQELLLAAIARHRATGGIAVVATHDALPIPNAQELVL